MMHGNEFGAVGKGSFDLHFRNQFGNAGHRLVSAEKFFAEIHEFGDRPSVANEFEQLRGDERDGLGMVQADAASETFLREKTRVVQEQLVNFARAQMHTLSPFALE